MMPDLSHSQLTWYWSVHIYRSHNDLGKWLDYPPQILPGTLSAREILTSFHGRAPQFRSLCMNMDF